MAVRPFRFGVVAASAPDGGAWMSLARRAEDLGYATLVMPDNVSAGLPAPLPALTAAAVATGSLRVGTFVHNCGVRRPEQLVWEAATVDYLSGGRFEFGVGAGRPGAESDGELLGVPYGSVGQRMKHLREVIRVYKTLLPDGPGSSGPGSSGPRSSGPGSSGRGHGPGMFAGVVQKPRPPLLMAAGGDRMLTLAAEEADIVTFALPPTTTEDGLAQRSGRLRELAGDRFGELELGINVAAVGDELAPWISRMLGADPKELAARGAITLLRGCPEEMITTLQRRRERAGVSYVTVSAEFMDQFAPVVERLGDE